MVTKTEEANEQKQQARSKRTDVALANLARHKVADAPVVSRASHAQLIAHAAKLAKRNINVLAAPTMELSARHPYDPAGLIDVYKPGRWDCTSNLLFMDRIVSTGPSPGEWDGTVAYGTFKAPADGTYLVVAHFSGYQTTMAMHGPWGTNTAYTATTSDTGVVISLWAAMAGEDLWFTLNCTAPGGEASIGYLESIQTFNLG
jgi:hypothetical protein